MLVIGSCLPSYVQATYGFSFATGSGCHSIFPIRVGVQKDWGRTFREHRPLPFTGYWEASFYDLHGTKKCWRYFNQHMNIIALAGVLRFQGKEPLYNISPYIDVGVGLSLISKKEMCGRQLGIHFQFEDRLGVGIRFGERKQFDIGYRVVHFSNAYLGKQNASINLHLLVLGYWFN